MVNPRVLGADGLPADLLKLGLNQDRSNLRKLHRLITIIWCKGEVPQRTIMATLKTECGSYRSISLISHAGKELLKVVARTWRIL